MRARKSDGPQASYCGGRLGTAAVGGGASGGCPGSGRRPAGAWRTGGAVPSAAADFGLMGVSRRGVVGVGTGAFGLPVGDSVAPGGAARFCGVAAALGGGADLRLAGSAAAVEPGLRGAAGEQCGVGTDCDEPADAAPFGPKPRFLDTLLDAPAIPDGRCWRSRRRYSPAG